MKRWVGLSFGGWGYTETTLLFFIRHFARGDIPQAAHNFLQIMKGQVWPLLKFRGLAASEKLWLSCSHWINGTNFFKMMCVCVYIYIYIYTHTHKCIHIYGIYIFVNVCVYLFMDIDLYWCIHFHTYDIYWGPCLSLCVRVGMCVYIYIYIYMLLLQCVEHSHEGISSCHSYIVKLF